MTSWKGVLMQVNQNSMMAHTQYMNASAQNVANVNTEDYQALQTTLQSSGEGNIQAVSEQVDRGTELSRDLTDQITIEGGFDAQVRSIKTQDEILGTLLDIKS